MCGEDDLMDKSTKEIQALGVIDLYKFYVGSADCVAWTFDNQGASDGEAAYSRKERFVVFIYGFTVSVFLNALMDASFSGALGEDDSSSSDDESSAAAGWIVSVIISVFIKVAELICLLPVFKMVLEHPNDDHCGCKFAAYFFYLLCGIFWVVIILLLFMLFNDTGSGFIISAVVGYFLGSLVTGFPISYLGTKAGIRGLRMRELAWRKHNASRGGEASNTA